MTEFWARADLEEAAFRGDELRRLGRVTDGRLVIFGMLERGEDLNEVECDACGDLSSTCIDVPLVRETPVRETCAA